MAASGWHRNSVLAWTEHDGPGRPPGSTASWPWIAPAILISAALGAIIFTDSLCPEHRQWVLALGSAGVFMAGTAVVGLLRGWSSAPWFTMVSAVLGVCIGVIDAAHEPARGTMLAVAFGAALALSTVLVARHLQLREWDRSVRSQLRSSSPHDANAPLATVVPPAGSDTVISHHDGEASLTPGG